MGVTGTLTPGGVTAPHSNRVEAAGRAAGVAEVPSNGSPARVPSSDLPPALEVAPRSAQVEALGREVAEAKAPGLGNKAEAEASNPVPALNPRAPTEAAQQVATRVVIAHGQTAPVVPIAVPVVAEGAGVMEVPAAGVAEGAGAVEAAVAGVKAKVLIGD